jgi:hypothetical protein
MRNTIAKLLFLLFWAALFVTAEEAPETAMPAVPEQSSHLTGEGPTLAVESDPDYRNVIVGSATVGAAFDTEGYTVTNPNGTTSSSSDIRFFAQPSIAMRQTRTHLVWTLAYTPGVSFSQHALDQTQYTQNASGMLTWTPNTRLLVHARQDYSLSTNPFETVGRVPILPELGGYFGPNYNGVIPSSKRTSLVSNADVTYKLTPHTAIGVTGGFQKYDYGFVSGAFSTTSPVLMNSEVVNASVFLSRVLSARQTIGIQGTYTDIYNYGLQPSRTQVPAVLIFDDFRINAHTMLSVYGGPGYPRTNVTLVPSFPPIRQNQWQPVIGGTFAWNGVRNALNLQVTRRTTNGGGLMGTTESTFGSAGFRSRLTRSWNSELRFSIDDEQQLQVFATNTSFRTLWAGGGITRDLGRHFAVRLDGAWIRQTGQGLSYMPGNHGLLQATLDFHFLKPVGR